MDLFWVVVFMEVLGSSGLFLGTDCYCKLRNSRCCCCLSSVNDYSLLYNSCRQKNSFIFTESKELAGLRFNWAALPLLDKHAIVHLGEDIDPQIFGFEGAIQIYFTSQGLEQFIPKPSAIKDCNCFWWWNTQSWDRQGRKGGGVALCVRECLIV